MEANYFTILYWFCHTSTWIHHGCTHGPHPEPPSHLPPRIIPLGHPSAPAPSILYGTWTGDLFLIWCKSKPQWGETTISRQSEWLLSKLFLKNWQTKNSWHYPSNNNWGCGEKEIFPYCWWECKLVQPL